MNIYRHKVDGRLYTITRLILDIKHLNNNAFAGIYATTFLWIGPPIILHSKDDGECNKFLEDHFEKIAYK